MEQRIGIERMEEAVNLFGSFDENIRLLEAEFQVHGGEPGRRARGVRRAGKRDAGGEGGAGAC